MQDEILQMSGVQEGAEDFFGEKAFLTASGQLHAESLAR